MAPVRSLAMMLLLVPAARNAAAAGDAKLIWTYPCSFSYADGSLYPKVSQAPGAKPLAPAPKGLECDYLRTQLERAAPQFNALPSFAAQERFLEDQVPQAHQAVAAYETQKTALLNRTDPTSIPALTAAAVRMQKLTDFRADLSNSGINTCASFLWQKREEPSYLENSNGAWPASWRPCMGAFEDRLNELNAQIHAGEETVVKQETSQVRARLQGAASAGDALSRTAALVQKPGAESGSLNKLYNGNPAHAAEPVAVQGEGTLPSQRALPAFSPRPTVKAPAVPLPLPADAAQEFSRNYFSRGYMAGMQRVADDAQIELWHLTGQSRTVGDPYGKSALVFDQKGPSCAIAAQKEVLDLHGSRASMQSLAEEALKKGYYGEETLRSGDRVGGTRDADLGKLLVDHGVQATVKKSATSADLEASIARSGMAIVAVNSQFFWNAPSVSPTSAHAVLVTGMEVLSDKTVAGYYVNDTGTDEGARFISKTDFLRAWNQKGSPLVQLQ